MFRRCRPLHPVRACRDYEYAREIPEIIELYKQALQNGKAQIDQLVSVAKTGSTDLIQVAKGFPDVPFLAGPHEKFKRAPKADARKEALRIEAVKIAGAAMMGVTVLPVISSTRRTTTKLPR